MFWSATRASTALASRLRGILLFTAILRTKIDSLGGAQKVPKYKLSSLADGVWFDAHVIGLSFSAVPRQRSNDRRFYDQRPCRPFRDTELTLGTNIDRPRCRGAAEERDEISSSHRISYFPTLSEARARGYRQGPSCRTSRVGYFRRCRPTVDQQRAMLALITTPSSR
jgi:hypothetical protein